MIKNIRKVSNDEIEITRNIFSNDFYNDKPYDVEKILIKRKFPDKKEEPIFISFYEDKLKKKVTTLSADNFYSVIVKFKSFRNPNEVLFYQNIFYYKSLLELHEYYKLLGKVPDKKEYNLKKLYYHEFINNLL